MEIVFVILVALIVGIAWLWRSYKSVTDEEVEEYLAEKRAERLGREPEQATAEAAQPNERLQRRVELRTSPVYSQACLPPDQEKSLVTVDTDGIPNLRLAKKWGQIVLYLPQHGLINDESRYLYRHDLYSFHVRGVTHYKASVRRTDLYPRRELKLVREPNNKFDSNAISIQAPSGTKPLGYVNKLNAKRLARRLDNGEEFKVIVLAVWPWENSVGFSVLIAKAPVMEHLLTEMVDDPDELSNINPTSREPQTIQNASPHAQPDPHDGVGEESQGKE